MTSTGSPVNPVDSYAAALLDIASSEADASAAVDEMYRALSGLGGNAELVDVLTDPRVPADRKQGTIDDILGSRASKVTVAAVNFVVAAGQGSHLTGIAAKLAELAADAEGEVVAEVRTPFDLDDAQIERLSAAISKATGKKIQVKIVVDSSVIGGVVAKVGDTVLDGSVQHRFTELREQWG
jgi:F-type H+-transporting ATPase subunit delta